MNSFILSLITLVALILLAIFAIVDVALMPSYAIDYFKTDYFICVIIALILAIVAIVILTSSMKQ